MDKTLAWLWLADAVGSACQYAQELLALYPDPAELYDLLRAGTEAPPTCLTPRALAQLQDTTPFDFEERLDHCLLSGIELLTPDEDAYPAALRDLPDLPLVLYLTGESACLNGQRCVGMVGTRRPSAYGRQAAFDLSLAMAQAGAVIVSGLADGLDSEAHRAALQADRPTIAFLGTAIDKTYPAANARLRTAIEKGGGAVCSEYPPGYTGRTTGTFLARNRLIAAQSEALCVAEARTRSGTLNTVHHAERLGRPVLAVPGSIYSALSEGTNELLRTHRAEPLCKAADALEILGIGVQAAAPEQQRFDPAAVSPDASGRLTLSIKGAGSVTLPGLAPAGYTVTESAAPDLTNYYLTPPTADRTRSLDVTAGGTVEAHFTNTYEPYLSVTITNKVVRDMGEPPKNLSFPATLDTTQIRQGSAYTTAGDGAALTDTGFTLRSGGSVTLTHLRADQTLTLTETDPGDHTVSWQLNGDDGPTGATCTIQVPRTQPAEITCINTRNVGIPTGLHTGAAPYLALVGLCWLGWRLLRCREV